MGSRSACPPGSGEGGDRYGGPGDLYYHIVRGTVSGASAGDTVDVWFTGGGATSDSFSFDVVGNAPKDVLVVAAEDYTGTSNVPAYPSPAGPYQLSYYTGRPDGERRLVRRLRRRRQWPHRHPTTWACSATTRRGLVHGQRPAHPRARATGRHGGRRRWPTTRCSSCRAYLNEGGRLLYTGRSAGWQYANAFDYNPLTTPPYCDNVDQTVDDGCLLLSDDFLQYWLGAYLFIEDGGTNPDGEPFPLAGNDGTLFEGLDWTLNGGDSADNHHPNASRGTTQSFLTTSSLLDVSEFPQFTSSGLATWQTGVGGRSARGRAAGTSTPTGPTSPTSA